MHTASGRFGFSDCLDRPRGRGYVAGAARHHGTNTGQARHEKSLAGLLVLGCRMSLHSSLTETHARWWRDERTFLA